jgi:hypothetical protein
MKLRAGELMNKREYPFIQWGVDVGKYNTRPIKSYFQGASDELATLVLNFCLCPELATIMDANWCSGSGASYARAKAALDLLRESGLIKVALNHGVHIGRARV